MFNTFWGCSHQNPGEPPTFSVENLQHMAEMTITALVLLFGLDCGLPTKQGLCTKLPLGPFGTANMIPSCVVCPVFSVVLLVII